MRRVFPEPGEIAADEVARGLDLAARAPDDRPYTVVNMISSADGKATLAGRTGGMGNEADRAIFHGLREEVDAVMAGAGTVTIERYGRLVRDPARRERRRAAGLEPDPLAVVPSGRLGLAVEVPLLQSPESRVVILTRSEAELDSPRARVDYIRRPAGEELATSLGRLRGDYGVRSMLCEGGPTLNATLFGEGLVDELWLALAPMLVGGAGALTIVGGSPLPEAVALELVSAIEDEGYLFLRYRVASTPGPAHP